MWIGTDVVIASEPVTLLKGSSRLVSKSRQPNILEKRVNCLIDELVS
jgi:hypothetical protein